MLKLVEKAKRKIRAFISRILTPPLETLQDCPDLFLVYRRLCIHPQLKRVPGGWIYRSEFYPDYLTVGGAGGAIFRVALRFCKGKGIDIGAGFWPLPGSIPIDLERGPGAGKTISSFQDNSLDYVFSSHCLEHIEDWKSALRLWVTKLKYGGIIFIYLPHPKCEIWHPGSPFVGNGHKWIPTPNLILNVLKDLGCKVIDKDDGPDGMFSFYICAQKSKKTATMKNEKNAI